MAGQTEQDQPLQDLPPIGSPPDDAHIPSESPTGNGENPEPECDVDRDAWGVPRN